MSDVTYIDAIHAALGKALEDDPSVFLYGQDIGKLKGSHGIVQGRVRPNTHQACHASLLLGDCVPLGKLQLALPNHPSNAKGAGHNMHRGRRLERDQRSPRRTLKRLQSRQLCVLFEHLPVLV